MFHLLVVTVWSVIHSFFPRVAQVLLFNQPRNRHSYPNDNTPRLQSSSVLIQPPSVSVYYLEVSRSTTVGYNKISLCNKKNQTGQRIYSIEKGTNSQYYFVTKIKSCIIRVHINAFEKLLCCNCELNRHY